MRLFGYLNIKYSYIITVIENSLYHSFRKCIMRKLLVSSMIGFALAATLSFSGCA